VVRPYEFAEPIHGEPLKPRQRVKWPSGQWSNVNDAPIVRVMVMGDPHDKPGRDKRRFTWMGRHAAETKPDYIVSIGDWASLDSLSTHEIPGSQGDADRPGFWEELDSLDDSLARYNVGANGVSAPRIHCHGNHEHRASRAANKQPKLNGDMPLRLDEVFARHGWRTNVFGEFVDIHGVDFVHCPLNVMGREMGGQHVERNVANMTTRSLVFGHTHRAQVTNFSKVGQQRKITVVNVGTTMPYGEIEKYTGLAMSGWSYGVFELRIRDGEILSVKNWDMLEIEGLYA
jgi:predicted phosphodiesterase